MILAVLVAYQVTNEGESNWFEGVQLLALYVILGLTFFFAWGATMEFVLLVISFAVILAGALLFTNAIEWVGHKLGLGEGAVGSLLAAVGTALPETLIAIVALVGATKSEDVAIGAIVGAPFLLATLAMGLVGGTAYLYRQRRKQDIDARGPRPDARPRPRLLHGLLRARPGARLRRARGAAAPGRASSSSSPTSSTSPSRSAAAARSSPRRRLNPLIMARGPKAATDPPLCVAIVQVLVGLAAMVGGAHLFVEELLHFAEELGVEAIVLSLILAPLATELPEKVNSFFWVREGKDSLALGNITGAMVFQSTIPVGIGLMFTDWELSGNAAISVGLGLAGGLIAFWALRLRDRFELPAVIGLARALRRFIVVVAV